MQRLKCAKSVNGKLKPVALLGDPDAPRPQGPLRLNALIFLFCPRAVHAKGRAPLYREIAPPLFVDVTS